MCRRLAGAAERQLTNTHATQMILPLLAGGSGGTRHEVGSDFREGGSGLLGARCVSSSGLGKSAISPHWTEKPTERFVDLDGTLRRQQRVGGRREQVKTPASS